MFKAALGPQQKPGGGGGSLRLAHPVRTRCLPGFSALQESPLFGRLGPRGHGQEARVGLGQGAPGVSVSASRRLGSCVLASDAFSVRSVCAPRQGPASSFPSGHPSAAGDGASGFVSLLQTVLAARPLNFRRKCHWGRGEGRRLEVTLACPLSGVFRSGTWAGAPASRPPPLPAASAWLLRARVSPEDVAAEAAGAGPRVQLRIQVFRAAAQNARNCRTSVSWPQLG